MAIPQQTISPKGRRLNKLPIVFTALLVGLFVGAIIWAGMQRRHNTDPNAGNDSEFLNQGTANSEIDLIKDRSNGLAGYDPDRKVDEIDPNASNIEDRIQKALDDSRLNEIRKQESMRQAQLDYQLELTKTALNGDTTIDVASSGGFSGMNMMGQGLSASTAGSPAGNQNPNQMQQLQQMMQGGSMGAGMTDNQTVNESREFLKNSSTDSNSFTLLESTRVPITDFEVKTGTIIPATMVSAINSDLPGDVIGQVSTNVYDSRTGMHLLIPQGSKLYGKYDSYTSMGQERLLVVWDRIIFPDTETLAIQSMQGVDNGGVSGFLDLVNTHFFRTLANAFLLSTVTAAVDKYDDNDSTGFFSDLTNEFGDTMEKVIAEYLENRLKIKPTLEIRAGYQFNIMVNKDIIFDSPYEYGYTKRLVSNEN